MLTITLAKSDITSLVILDQDELKSVLGVLPIEAYATSIIESFTSQQCYTLNY